MQVNRSLIVTGVLLLVLTWGVGPALGGDAKVYTMTGWISAIDRTYDTVVVEVPVQNKSMTVGGPLVQGAVLEKNGRQTGLEAFEVGEQVAVTWEKNDEGLYIRRLRVRSQ